MTNCRFLALAGLLRARDLAERKQAQLKTFGRLREFRHCRQFQHVDHSIITFFRAEYACPVLPNRPLRLHISVMAVGLLDSMAVEAQYESEAWALDAQVVQKLRANGRPGVPP